MYCIYIYRERCLVPRDTCTLYIPTDMYNIIQLIIIHNLFFQHCIRLGSDPLSLSLPSTTPPPGKSISTPPRGEVPLFRHGSY
jgi:hypothetical protein